MKKKFILFSVLGCFLFTLVYLTNSTNIEPNQNKVIKNGEIQPVSDPVEYQMKHSKKAWSEKKKKVKGIAKFDQPDRFAKYFAEIKTRAGEKEPRYSMNYKIEELNKAISRVGSLQKQQTLNWVNRGPSNVGGRTRAIVVDPDDNTYSTWFAAAVSGGIWKTTDKGQSWTNKTEDLPNLAVTSMAMAASNHDVIYAGTGEGFYNTDATTGNGIFKTTDRGETWTQLASTANNLDFQNINRVVVDPNDENVVLICSNTSYKNNNSLRRSVIMKSTDGGNTWTKVYDAPSYGNRVQQIVANPQNFNVLYATVNGLGVLKSTDAGNTWTLKGKEIAKASRIEIAVAPSNPDVLYASVEAGDQSDIYKSEDAGETWVLVNDKSGTNPTYLGGQGWYDNAIAVDPFDENTFYVGGIDFYKVTMEAGIDTSKGISSIEQSQNLSDFMGFINWGASFLGGGFDYAKNWWDFLGTVKVNNDDYVSIEIRFGPGKKQMAHRFLRNSSGNYEYQDYVEVPFEVWDIDNNKQLMVSFRDSKNNGVYDYYHYDRNNLTREYINIHAVEYNSTIPFDSIKVVNGVLYKSIYFLWPYLPDGATWEPDNLPDAYLRVNYSNSILTYKRDTEKLTHWYSNYQKPGGGVYPYIHADQHYINCIITNNNSKEYFILVGNDGGVFYSMDKGVTWNGTQNGYITTQFYGADKKPGANQFIGGTQDNGTWLSPAGEDASSSTNYKAVLGGDGFDCAWNYDNPNLLLGSLYNNRIYRSENGGQNWYAANNGFTDYNHDDSPFITTIAKTNTDPYLVFAAGPSGIWRSDDFGASWALSTTDKMWYSSSRTPVAVSDADPRIVWAGQYIGYGYSLNVSQDGGVTFSSTTIPTDLTLGYVSGIATHPTDANTAYALFSYADGPKVVRTTDLGQTWEDISGFVNNAESGNGFPDVAVYCLLVMPYDTNILWAGTDIGIVESTDGGQSWHIAQNGLPHVNIWQMRIVDDQIVVATHGRGIWSVTIPELNGYTPPAVTFAPRLTGSSQTPTNLLNVNYEFRSDYDSVQVKLDGNVATTVKENTVKGSGKITVMPPNSDKTAIQLVAYKNGEVYKSAIKEVNILQLKPAKDIFVTNWNYSVEDFDIVGFEVKKETGFSNNAIHTPHPYETNKDYSFTLKQPIIVKESDAYLMYKDIAIIEPGDAGTKFGDYKFWDYVVVEGTKDGENWTPLADGYDVNYNSSWTQFYTSTEFKPTEANYIEHNINLLDKFSAGDTILIRFRLYSDEYTTGWGWVVDDIGIQADPTGVEDEISQLPKEFALMQNYPNPFNPSTTIKFNIAKASKVRLTIYDQLGREVETLINKNMQPGRYSKVWNARNLASGVYFYRLEAGNFKQVKKLILLK